MQSNLATSHDARHRYAGALQSALTLDEVGDAFLGVVDGVVPANGFGLYRFDSEGKRVLDVRAAVDADFLEDYEEYGRPDDPVLDFVVQQRRPIDSSRVVSARQWESCGARSALAVGGYYHSLEAPVIVSGSVFGTMNFARSPELPPFSDADLVAARFAGEQLGLAAERALRFEITGRRASVLENALDRVQQPVIVTDLEAQVVFRNRAARNLPAAQQKTVDDEHGPVQATIAEAMEEFRLHGKRVHTRSVRDARSDQQLIVKSYRLADANDAAVTLIFSCSGEEVKRLPAWDVLSRREQEIAELVAQGLTTKQIAERAFISENTVKQHLKRVFAKTDVHNRAELVQLIWASGRPAAEAAS